HRQLDCREAIWKKLGSGGQMEISGWSTIHALRLARVQPDQQLGPEKFRDPGLLPDQRYPLGPLPSAGSPNRQKVLLQAMEPELVRGRPKHLQFSGRAAAGLDSCKGRFRKPAG